MAELRKSAAEKGIARSGKKSSRLHEIVDILRRSDMIHGVTPQKLRIMLEELGPTFVKLGQIMSMRSDMLPQAYCDELKKLRSGVVPMPFETVEEILAAQYGRPAEDVFAWIDRTPLGSASVAQVHAARLPSGQPVVIKVQRRGIHRIMEEDIAILRRAARLLKIVPRAGDVIDFNGLLDELWTVSQQEMNFLVEAEHLERFGALNEDVAYASSPRVYRELSTASVLVMENISGIPIDHLDELRAAGYALGEIGEKLAENYIKQILDDGFFHADPHPGNLRIRDGKIIWIDFGMMGTLQRSDKDLMKKAVQAIGSNDTELMVDVILTLGVHDGRIDYTLFYDDMEIFMKKYIHMDLNEINLGDAIQEVFTIAHKHRISMPKGISMLARGLVTMESTMTLLDPKTNIIQIAAAHVSEHIFKKLDAKKEAVNAGRKLYEAGKRTLDIPIQFSELMRMITKGRIKLNLEIMDSSVPLKTINHMVNKLVVGIVSCGLLMASSLICTTDMTPKVLGIPAIGFIGYMTAVFLGMWLLYTVLKDKRR